MIESLVKKMCTIPDEVLIAQSLEDMTLAATWFDSYLEADPLAVAPYKQLHEKLDTWVNQVQPLPDDTEGIRQQPLLRLLLNEAVRGKLATFSPDELDFLFFAYGMAKRSQKPDLFGRTLECLEPHINQISALRETGQSEPGLSKLSERIGIYSADDIRKAEARDIKVFAGLNFPIRGPVLIHRGDAKIIDLVPPGTAVVVEGGSCYITGRIDGMVAATENCEVLGHIAGVAVARRGAVRCATILNQATVVSKEGSIACFAAEDPRLVFGCKEISIKSAALGGRYLGRDIVIGGELLGGEVQGTAKVEAGAFRMSDGRKTAVVLRRSLTCADYGEVLLIEASRLLSAAMKLSQRRTNIENLLAITTREADEFAGNVLLFLLGDHDSSERVEEIQELRRRAAFLDRLSAAIKGLVQVIEDRLAEGELREGSSQNGDERMIIEQLQRELLQVAGEGSLDPSLFKHKEDVLHFGRKMQGRHLLPGHLVELLYQLVQKNEELDEMRVPIEDIVDKRESSLEQHLERKAILERAKAEQGRVRVLEQLIAVGRSRGRAAGPKFQQRINDRYIKLMRRNIEHRLTRLGEYRNTIGEMNARIQEIRDKLWETYQVSLPDHVLEGWTREGAYCRGQFDEGVWLCAWPYLVSDGRPGVHGLTLSPDSEGEIVTYQRTPQGQIVANE